MNSRLRQALMLGLDPGYLFQKPQLRGVIERSLHTHLPAVHGETMTQLARNPAPSGSPSPLSRPGRVVCGPSR